MKEKTLIEKIEEEKERAKKLGMEVYWAIQRVEVDVKETVEKLKEEATYKKYQASDFNSMQKYFEYLIKKYLGDFK